MNTNELKETTIHVMSKVIVNTNPKMVIRRLQDDNAFAIYSNVDATDRIGNTHKHTILIDIVTEKTKPGFFKTIKNIIKVLEKPRRHYFSYLFHSVIIKDKKDNVINCCRNYPLEYYAKVVKYKTNKRNGSSYIINKIENDIKRVELDSQDCYENILKCLEDYFDNSRHLETNSNIPSNVRSILEELKELDFEKAANLRDILFELKGE